MTKVEKHFRLFLIVIGLAFDPLLGRVQAQSQAGQQAPAGASILTMLISNGWTTNLQLEGHIHLIRSVGVPVGLETDVSRSPILKPVAYGSTLITISNETVNSALNKITGAYPGFIWHFDSGPAYVDVYPKTGALCFASVPACSITNHSLVRVFESDLPGLNGLKIDLVEPWARGRPVNKDLFVDLEFKGGTLMEFLNQLALSLGIGGRVSWTLNPSFGHPYLRFNFTGSPMYLPSYRPSKEVPFPPWN
jgi:hypothetical protein